TGDATLDDRPRVFRAIIADADALPDDVAEMRPRLGDTLIEPEDGAIPAVAQNQPQVAIEESNAVIHMLDRRIELLALLSEIGRGGLGRQLSGLEGGDVGQDRYNPAFGRAPAAREHPTTVLQPILERRRHGRLAACHRRGHHLLVLTPLGQDLAPTDEFSRVLLIG